MKLLLVSLSSIFPSHSRWAQPNLSGTQVWRLILELLSLLFLLLGKPVARAAAPVSFKCIENLVVVEAAVNGVSGSYILDTGSPFTILNKAFFSSNFSKRMKEEIVDIFGKPTQVAHLLVKTANLSDVQLPVRTARLLDLSMYEQTKNIVVTGILGQDAFKGMAMILDFQHNLLYLSEGSQNSGLGYVKVDSMSFKMNEHIPCIQASFAGKDFWFAIDTGSEMNLFHQSQLKGRHEHFLGSGRILLKGMGTSMQQQSKGWLKNFQTGQQAALSLEVVLTDFSGINQYLAFPLDGLLGVAFLKQNLISIDYTQHKIYFLQTVDTWVGTQP